MPAVTILTESELRRAVPLDAAAVDCVEDGFKALAGGKVVMPPILSLAVHEYNGEVDVKTAYVPGLKSFAIKVSPGFFDNPKLGLPSTSGLMMVFSSTTGVLEALLLENGYLTDVRTAAAGAVAARHLSRPDAESACIFGAGMQARLQFKALQLVRPIRKASFWARDPAKAAALADKIKAETGVDASATDDPADAVADADIIVTTTPASQPILKAEWLRSGQHITAMGSDQSTKNELDPACLTRADLYVPDRQSQTEILGELRTALASGTVQPGQRYAELGDIASGLATGRTSPDAITICDLTGTGVQDTAISGFALNKALGLGLGSQFNS